MDYFAMLMPMSYLNRTTLWSGGTTYQHLWSLNSVVKRLRAASELSLFFFFNKHSEETG